MQRVLMHSNQASQTSYEQYLETLYRGFWDYAGKQLLARPELLDRLEQRKVRPPVFHGNEAWRNILLPAEHDQSIMSKIISAIPVKERHKHFGSMRSSQALAQSIFGSLAALGKTSLLTDVISDEGLPAFPNVRSNARMELEKRVNYLGEPRPTSVDVWIEAPYRIAVECKYTEPDFGSCSRPELKPGRDSNYDRDHCDGTYTRQRGRHTRCSLTEIGVAYWKHVPNFFHWDAATDLRPCPLRQTYQLARNVLAACIGSEGAPDPDSGHALIIYDARNPAFAPGSRAHVQWSAAKRDLKRPDLLRSCSWQTLITQLAADNDLGWLVDGLGAKHGLMVGRT